MSFYNPHVFCCTNRRPDDHPRGSCAARGGEELRQYLKEKMKQAGVPQTRINAAGCLDQCENGPVLVVYPEGIWYRAQTRADIDRIVTEHFIGGVVVADLQLTQKVQKAK